MKKYSVAIFGSSVREDFDKYSDKDLLIVAETYEQLRNLEIKYSKEDWSISFYTYSKLNYLAKKGSLFLKHLKDEAKIVIDTKGELNNILSNYSLKKDYEFELKDSEDFFQVLEYIPNSKNRLAWFCDTLYVGLRNYLIFSNAKENIFEFSFNKLLKKLRTENNISNDQMNILKELRVVKRNYREDIYDEFPSLDFVNKVLNIIDKFKFINKIQVIEPNQFRYNVENIITSSDFSPYQKLRLIEGYYNSQNEDISDIKKIISNPQFYAIKFKDNEFTSNLISTIKNATQHWLSANSGQLSEK